MSANYGDPIVIPCRVKYCNLVSPDTEGQFARGNHNLMVLIPKDDEATMLNILGACAEVAGVSSFKELRKHPFTNQTGHFRDGDDTNANKGLKDQDQLGHYFCTIGSSQHFDTFVYENGEYVECSRAEIYDGCYAAVLCTPSENRPGEVTMYLNAVTKMADGPRIGRRVDPRQAMLNWAPPADMVHSAVAKPQTTQPAFGVAPQVTPVQPPPAFGGGQQGTQQEAAEAGPVRPKRGRPAKSLNDVEPLTAPVAAPVNGRSSLNDLMNKA